ncbi:MAG: hypothetical protein JW936_07510 [Sedimentisphaerales bacterium]|nr:hypothetical protein [Sedimentisphaerales bacterium]
MRNDQDRQQEAGLIRRVGLLHYHLAGGGVHTVMMNQARAMIAGFETGVHIELISHDAEQPAGKRAQAELQQWAQEKYPEKDVRIGLVEVAGLGYDDSPASSRIEFMEQAGTLAEEILGRISLKECSREMPYILHCHNMNVGKNPRATAAVKLIAERMEAEDLPGWVLYQMHDFAEDNRARCWRALRRCTGVSDAEFAAEIMYPSSERIIWACINTADRELLQRVGIEGDRTVVLPNAVDIGAFTGAALDEMNVEQLRGLGLERGEVGFGEMLKRRIGEYAERKGFLFDAGRKILLAPVKAIRRKNIYESVLLLMELNRCEDVYQLLVTLDARNQEDKEYSEAIEGFVRDNHLPIVFGLGHELLKPGSQREIRGGEVKMFGLVDMLHICEAVVTTSVQEGFGYAFHEPWLAGKAVLGRNIAKVTKDFCDNGMRLEHLYDCLLIPHSWLADEWDEIAGAYYEKNKKLHRAAGIEAIGEDEFAEALTRTKVHQLGERGEATVDWANLSSSCQLRLLQEFIVNPSRLKELVWTNEELTAFPCWRNESVSAIISHNKNVVASHYDLRATAQRLREIQSLGDELLDRRQDRSQTVLSGSNRAIFAQFLDLSNMRLLT